MRVKLMALGVSLAILPGIAHAGFGVWTTETEKDPFSGGERVTVNLSTSMRSGVIIICDTAQKGVTVRAIPGFAFEAGLVGAEPMVEFAIDGERILGETGATGSVGDNLAASEVVLLDAAAGQFVDAFSKAKKQIAIRDGISDRPHLLTARGSTKAGEALVKCMASQTK